MSKSNIHNSHDFAQVAKEIPTLIAEEMKNSAISKQGFGSSAKQQKASPVYTSPIRSKRWMFIGVGVCLLTILGFWSIYITDTIEQNKLTLNPAKAFTDSGQNDFSMIINTFANMENELKGNIKSPSELKMMVVQALMPLLATSSTIASTTTSTANTTSSIRTVTTTP